LDSESLLEKLAEHMSVPLSDEEKAWTRKHHIKRPKAKIDEVIMFQTGLITDIFNLLAINVNKKISSGEVDEQIQRVFNLSDKMLEERPKEGVKPRFPRKSSEESNNDLSSRVQKTKKTKKKESSKLLMS